MAGNFKVGMTLTARDDASLKLVKGLKLTKKAAEDAVAATRKSGREQKRTDDESISSTKRVVTELQRAARARETLGIRSEHEIRRQIALTEASYNRLARSGVMSAREQARAWRATKEQIRELKREMRGVGTLAKAANIGGNVLT
ncbi:tail length tape measure protein, partial [Salmonella enterica subsp. enterica serovar Newport]|nr:tail length tape measure protein [Salmonella enterica subsp. enterica serovar Newport]